MKKGDKLKELQEKKSSLELQLRNCDTRKQEILVDLNKSKDLMRNQDQLRRNIEDNLNYRKTKAEVDELSSEIESLEEEILKIGGVSAVESNLTKISQERERLLSEVFMIPVDFIFSYLFNSYRQYCLFIAMMALFLAISTG